MPTHLFLTSINDHLFIQVLYNLLITLDNFSMKRLEESLELTVQYLVDLTHIETSKYLYDKRIIRNKRLVRDIIRIIVLKPSFLFILF